MTDQLKYTYSFAEIINIELQKLENKLFTRIDTDEFLGGVLNKYTSYYGTNFEMEPEYIIEFWNEKDTKLTVVYGNTIENWNKKRFRYLSTQ